MFSNKENINILTSLLRQHGVETAVVCPGSRNAPIVHNLNEARMRCLPVTDERSAGFFALGAALATRRPVAVCVTSGTALLNLAPAVAEAFYRHQPLIVVSADRPEAWIDQLDGQTLPQGDALGRFLGAAVTLPEPANDEQRWHCARLVNEAMTAASAGCPVHINVPISEPLFTFDTEALPDVRPIRAFRPKALPTDDIKEISDRILNAARPMVIAGQCDDDNRAIADALRAIGRHAVVLHEPLCPGTDAAHFDEVVAAIGGNDAYRPDFILYAGDTIVSKRMKRFVRSTAAAETWAISADGAIHDTFMNQTAVIAMPAADALTAIATALADKGTDTAKDFITRWHEALDKASRHAETFVPRYSQMMAVKEFEAMVDELDYDCQVHYANSMAVRLACVHAHHYIYVNRGVNGIEGSLSTAAGFAAMHHDMTFCVTGDLSFFYDSNALWNTNLRGNLRILLLNNCGGGIFRTLPGLDRSPVCDSMVAAEHHDSAHGLCDAHDIGYISARNAEELATRMQTFINSGTHRPLVFEVFTDAAEDAAVYREYINALNL